jgi:hypothetical protein
MPKLQTGPVRDSAIYPVKYQDDAGILLGMRLKLVVIGSTHLKEAVPADAEDNWTFLALQDQDEDNSTVTYPAAHIPSDDAYFLKLASDSATVYFGDGLMEDDGGYWKKASSDAVALATVTDQTNPATGFTAGSLVEAVIYRKISA